MAWWESHEVQQMEMGDPFTWEGMLVPGQAGNQLGKKQLCKRGPQNLSRKKKGYEAVMCLRNKEGRAQHHGLH